MEFLSLHYALLCQITSRKIKLWYNGMLCSLFLTVMQVNLFVVESSFYLLCTTWTSSPFHHVSLFPVLVHPPWK